MNELDFENIKDIAIESVDTTISLMSDELGNKGLQAYCQVAGVAFLRMLIANRMYHEKVSYDEALKGFLPMLKKSTEAYFKDVVLVKAGENPNVFEM